MADRGGEAWQGLARSRGEGATMAPILNGKQKGKPQPCSPHFPISPPFHLSKNRPWQDNERTMLDSQDTKGRWPKWANKHRHTHTQRNI